MSKTNTNTFGQPIGEPVPDWVARPLPPKTSMIGRFCRVEPLEPERHWQQLHAADGADADGANWTYSPNELPRDAESYRSFIVDIASKSDPMFHAIIDQATGAAVGAASYMRIDPGNGVIEVGNIRYSPALQRKPAATEAMYLMMRRVFDDLGYRRYEWKCDSLNAPSRAAAKRLGFCFEGEFRQAVVYKGRNRDTTWFSVIDSEWPALKTAFETWLAPANFDSDGNQILRLSELTAKTRQS